MYSEDPYMLRFHENDSEMKNKNLVTKYYSNYIKVSKTLYMPSFFATLQLNITYQTILSSFHLVLVSFKNFRF